MFTVHFNFTLIQFTVAIDIDEYLRRCASLRCRSILRLAPLSSGGHSINVAPFVIYFDVIVPATRVYKYCFHILNTFVFNVINEPVSIVFFCFCLLTCAMCKWINVSLFYLRVRKETFTITQSNSLVLLVGL